MADRWSALDRAIYGAEDHEEMEMILDHLDRAMADPSFDNAARPSVQSKRQAKGKKPPR
jgi:hypothetical protein